MIKQLEVSSFSDFTLRHMMSVEIHLNALMAVQSSAVTDCPLVAKSRHAFIHLYTPADGNECATLKFNIYKLKFEFLVCLVEKTLYM